MNKSEESLYNILGVDENANTEEIKKAYRKLSLKYHPDKPGGDEEMFKKISNAYSILESTESRKQYDMERVNPFTGGKSFFQNNNSNTNPEEFFANLFGGMGMGMGMGRGFPIGVFPSGAGIFNMGGNDDFPFGGGGGHHNIRVFHNGIPVNIGGGNPMVFEKPSPILKTINIQLSQVLTDFTVPIEIERWIIENNLKVFEKEVLYINIPKGIDNGEVIVIKDKGNVAKDTLKGDVKISISIENKTDFVREGLDLIFYKKISLKDAICGFSFCLEYINGKIYTLNNNEGSVIVPGYRKNIPNLGLSRENHTGNLIIVFDVEFPKEYSPEVIKTLKEIL